MREREWITKDEAKKYWPDMPPEQSEDVLSSYIEGAKEFEKLKEAAGSFLLKKGYLKIEGSDEPT